MSPENVNAILGVLADHPGGVTAKIAARELCWKETAASLRMGRLACAGVIDRTSPPGRANNLFLYHAKPEAPLAPEQPKWVPAETRIAEREWAHV